MRLRTVSERDAAIREHVETNHFFDERTGEPYDPQEPPIVDDSEGDEDAE